VTGLSESRIDHFNELVTWLICESERWPLRIRPGAQPRYCKEAWHSIHTAIACAERALAHALQEGPEHEIAVAGVTTASLRAGDYLAAARSAASDPYVDPIMLFAALQSWTYALVKGPVPWVPCPPPRGRLLLTW